MSILTLGSKKEKKQNFQSKRKQKLIVNEIKMKATLKETEMTVESNKIYEGGEEKKLKRR